MSKYLRARYLSERLKALYEFKTANLIHNLSMITDSEGHAEPNFSTCDVCNNGLKNNVYEAEGCSHDYKEVHAGFDVCIECLAAEANGFDSDCEIEIDNKIWNENK